MKIGPKTSLPIKSAKPQGKNPISAKEALTKSEDTVTLENSAELNKVLDIMSQGAESGGAEEIQQIAGIKAASSNNSPLEQVAQGLLDDSAILQALLGEDGP